MDDSKSYEFPSMREIADLSLPNGSLASISIPSSLLEETASGKVHGGTVCSEYTTTQYYRENVCVSGQCAVYNNPDIPAYFF